MSNLEEMYNRIVVASYSDYEHRDPNKVRPTAFMFIEYLRRIALWAERLNAPETWPITDIAGLISPTIEVSQQYIDELRQMGFRLFERLWLTNALKWSALIDQQKLPDHLNDLPSPFEPLILFLENKGLLDVRIPDYIEITGFGIIDNIKNKYSYYLKQKPYDLPSD